MPESSKNLRIIVRERANCLEVGWNLDSGPGIQALERMSSFWISKTLNGKAGSGSPQLDNSDP